MFEKEAGENLRVRHKKISRKTRRNMTQIIHKKMTKSKHPIIGNNFIKCTSPLCYLSIHQVYKITASCLGGVVYNVFRTDRLTGWNLYTPPPNLVCLGYKKQGSQMEKSTVPFYYLSPCYRAVIHFHDSALLLWRN